MVVRVLDTVTGQHVGKEHTYRPVNHDEEHPKQVELEIHSYYVLPSVTVSSSDLRLPDVYSSRFNYRCVSFPPYLCPSLTFVLVIVSGFRHVAKPRFPSKFMFGNSSRNIDWPFSSSSYSLSAPACRITTHRTALGGFYDSFFPEKFMQL